MKTLCLIPLLLTACASITTGQNQSLAVHTIPSSECTLVNDKGTWYVNSPGTVNVQRAYSDMTVTCTHGKQTGQSVVKSKTKGMAAGNLLFGLIGAPIGGAVDVGTGAAYDYPSPIEVKLQ